MTMPTGSDARASAEKALRAYEDLYKVPNEDRYIIDGDEAQVASDLAAALRMALAYAVTTPEDVREALKTHLLFHGHADWDDFDGEVVADAILDKFHVAPR